MPPIPPAGAYPVGSYPDALTPVDDSTSGVFAADAIDPETRDYRSIERGTDPTEAAALVALLTKRRSGSAVRDDGLNTADIQLVDEAFETTLRAEIAYAWRRLIADGQLEIVSIEIDTEDVAASVNIRIRNLTQQGAEQTIPVPLLALQGTR